MGAKFELYKDAKGEFRWRLVASNGQTIATSGEGYKSKDSARAGIESVKKNAPIAEIKEK
ncbi:MAG TPA: HVO_2922 family protein [Dehalococcoidia bacterium]|nr:HVO_2922 family protein [Dehalococcoidia bacterium]